jgi:hypothetical protein
VKVRVADDGCRTHFNGRGGGQCLIGMRERAAGYGGILSAGPRPAGGYLVEANYAAAFVATRRSYESGAAEGGGEVVDQAEGPAGPVDCRLGPDPSEQCLERLVVPRGCRAGRMTSL